MQHHLKIELLAPAANFECGVAAINAGADAVYIGGPAFGAREKAGNSIDDIARLAEYAHRFGAKVYMTMNTIIYESELKTAEQLAWQAWENGVDALIVQDMGLLEMNLPPIPLHASTQTFNLTAERVSFLQEVGFERVILERGISLEEIQSIRQKTHVELEAFVHGAICVGYSGQCYLSHAVCGRSANRGACAQLCRSQWTLTQEDGTVLSRNQTLLSPGDLNLSQRLDELISAGICSLKIEGRLKDESYVVNNVAHYNKKLNALGAQRTSCGVSTPSFEPNPEKSFSRSFSEFMLPNRHPEKSLLNHSKGEFLGIVVRKEHDFIELDTIITVNNGDGISFTAAGSNTISGTNVNTAQQGRIYPNRMDGIAPGTEIYRNLDRSFNPKAVRRIDCEIVFEQDSATATDYTGTSATVTFTAQEQASNPDKARENIKNAFSKSGDTIFRVTNVDIHATPFLPISSLNELRRSLLEKLLQARLASYTRAERTRPINHPQLPTQSVDYRANVANSLSRQFYQKCGVTKIAPAYELEKQTDAVLLRTRHCIRRELGVCLKQSKGTTSQSLFIENNGKRFALKFDCAACEMTICEL